MKISHMRIRITFQKYETEEDEIGNRISEWIDDFSCFATISGTSGTEESGGTVISVHEKADFTIRYFEKASRVEPDTHRIVFGNRIYNIKSVDDMGFKHNSLKFHTERERDGSED